MKFKVTFNKPLTTVYNNVQTKVGAILSGEVRLNGSNPQNDRLEWAGPIHSSQADKDANEPPIPIKLLSEGRKLAANKVIGLGVASGVIKHTDLSEYLVENDLTTGKGKLKDSTFIIFMDKLKADIATQISFNVVDLTIEAV